METRDLKILMIAGESSGDAHGARLVRALRAGAGRDAIEIFGAAGRRMREEGVEAVVDAERLSIIGAFEIVRELPMFLRSYRKLKAAAAARKPDAVVLIDFPEFNLRFARSMRKAGIRVIYYISPQLWAWRKSRVRLIRRNVDLLLSILPFEKGWYAAHGVRQVEYVGNPLAGDVRANLPRSEFCEKYGLDPARPIIALLAGSRRTELERILPALLATARRMRVADPALQFVIPLAPARSPEEAMAVAEESGMTVEELESLAVLVRNDTFDAVGASDAAAVTSGTATLETAILGTPMAIVYKSSVLNYRILRPLISVEFFGLVNLVAGKRVAAELIQDDLNPANLSKELFRLLEPAENARIRRELAEVRASLGDRNASERAASLILDLIRS